MRIKLNRSVCQLPSRVPGIQQALNTSSFFPHTCQVSRQVLKKNAKQTEELELGLVGRQRARQRDRAVTEGSELGTESLAPWQLPRGHI